MILKAKTISYVSVIIAGTVLSAETLAKLNPYIEEPTHFSPACSEYALDYALRCDPHNPEPTRYPRPLETTRVMPTQSVVTSSADLSDSPFILKRGQQAQNSRSAY